ncbi:HD domain-containing phosphohydrolase [Methylobacterium sp.]|uniref:HD-GYP domain-containing protein n=1 Tax=Methylobacterium sp. TaxID=409 RepID=UPI002600EE03|nr:HD domain-containing phosphohydrolase [Methylobacterium sp.]
MAQESFVLIVSDRPDLARDLARGLVRVIRSRVLTPRVALPVEIPLIVLVDVDDEANAADWLSRYHAFRVPCLYAPRKAAADAATAPHLVGATRTLSAGATRPIMLAALFDLIDAVRQARVQTARASVRASLVNGLAGQAGLVIQGAFEAAETGQPVKAAEIDSGTEVILEAVSDCGIRAWLDTIAKHDSQLYQHSLSVAGFAAAFALELNFNRADQMRLAKAALLHDLGKARIPVSILNKPGKLDAEEMAVMRTHPDIGADILAGQGEFDRTMLDVVRHHHEMLDGSGYPAGLSGDRIPDLVRLVTICDIHSALTERRAYRQPLPHDEAHGIMCRMSSKLDLVLLKAFAPIVLRSAGYALVD